MKRTTEAFVASLREFERTLEQEMPAIQCSVHLCLGQEEVPAALFDALQPKDWVFSTHRSHGHYLAKGGDPQALRDEIYGLASGVNGGFSGSQSFCDAERRFHSTAIVGGLIGPAVGAALGEKLAGSSAIVVCCLGDAATEQGVFWEGLNFAALHHLPILFVVENNGLSVHAPLSARQARGLLPRVEAFGARAWRGVAWLRGALARRGDPGYELPAVVEVDCHRACRHVSAMEDLRE